jgi:hypothetical protein
MNLKATDAIQPWILALTVFDFSTMCSALRGPDHPGEPATLTKSLFTSFIRRCFWAIGNGDPSTNNTTRYCNAIRYRSSDPPARACSHLHSHYDNALYIISQKHPHETVRVAAAQLRRYLGHINLDQSDRLSPFQEPQLLRAALPYLGSPKGDTTYDEDYVIGVKPEGPA